MTVKQVFNTSAELDYPTVLPTLDLDFANSKTLDPRITFTRASGGSYVGADGLIKYAGVNEARFDHDPVTGESLGFLVEESRSNRIINSEAVSTWTISNMIPTGNSVLLPNGVASTGVEYRGETEDANTKLLRPLPSGSGIVAGDTWTFSVFLRAGSEDICHLALLDRFNSGSTGRNFDMVNGVFTGPQGFGGTVSQGSSGVEKYPNGWWRVWISAVFTINEPGGHQMYLRLWGNSGSVPFTTSFSAWGAQLEVGAFPTSYIPTEASTRTRAADNASITGKNFSEWYRQDEGTIYADTKINGVQTTRFDRLWAITNANLNFEGISIFISGVSSGIYVFSIDVTNSSIPQVVQQVIETALTTPRLKSVFALKQNNCAGAVNGQQRFVDSTVDLSLFTTPVNRLLIGQPQRFQGTSCMTISRFTYFPKRLSNSNLQTLTS